MGDHDAYGKAVMRRAAGSAFHDWGSTVQVRYRTSRGGATIDGVVGDSVAVEIESRVSKQIRGAVLDLICHDYPKRLLVLIPVHMFNPALCADQCHHILGRFLKPEDYRVVILAGSGFEEALERDAALVRAALQELGFRGVSADAVTPSHCRVCGEELTAATRRHHEICEIRSEDERRHGATPPEVYEPPPGWDNSVRRIEEAK